jgi:hypothetical protein
MSTSKMVSVFKELLNGPATRYEISRKVDFEVRCVGRILTEMRKQGMIYVISYTNETDGRNRVKVWSLGEGEDAKPRQTQSQEARSRKSYLKKTAVKRIPVTVWRTPISWQ